MIRSLSRHYRLLTGALTVAAAACVLLRLERVEVEGDSMHPTLHPGDRLIVLRGGRVRADDLVTLPDPRSPQRIVVKRVAQVTADALAGDVVVVRGDNPDASTDSRVFGPVPVASVQGRVIYRYFPETRRGRPQRERYSAGDVG